MRLFPEILIEGDVDASNYVCSSPLSVEWELVASDPPTGLRLLGAIPNPIRASASIAFSFDEDNADVAIRMFDVAGRLVRRFDGFQVQKGLNLLEWNGRSDAGIPAASGVYFVRVVASKDQMATMKLVVIR